jgi:hypothetical protein
LDLSDPDKDENNRALINKVNSLTGHGLRYCRDMVSAQAMFYESDLADDEANNYAEKLNETKERTQAIVHRISEYIESNPEKPAEFLDALMELHSTFQNVVNLLEEHIEEVMGVDPLPFRSKHVQINEIGWDSEGQAFVIELASKFDIATAGEHADFKILANLEIVTGEATFTEMAETTVAKAPDAESDDDGFIELEPLYIPWDRDGGRYCGNVLVKAKATFVIPSEGGMTQIDPTSTEIDISVPEDDD